MIVKVCEISSLAVFAAAGVAADLVGPAIPWADWIMRFGALGLCGFMVFQNYRQMRETNRVLNRKDAEIRRLSDNSVAAMNRIAEALEDRPCLAGDSRVQAGLPAGRQARK